MENLRGARIVGNFYARENLNASLQMLSKEALVAGGFMSLWRVGVVVEIREAGRFENCRFTYKDTCLRYLKDYESK